MTMRTATDRDLDILTHYDQHISKIECKTVIGLGRVSIMELEGRFIGWLRYSLFWDNTPFMNMLYFLEDYRGKGYGRQAVRQWERDMKAMGFHVVMTSTASNEYAQHFYTKLGYMAVGSFLPLNDPLELIFQKEI